MAEACGPIAADLLSRRTHVSAIHAAESTATITAARRAADSVAPERRHAVNVAHASVVASMTGIEIRRRDHRIAELIGRHKDLALSVSCSRCCILEAEP